MRKLKKYKPTKFKAKDSHYDVDAADYAVSFIECLCHTKGTWAGKPFELIDWQEQIIRDLFGTLKPNGYRQFNTAYVEFLKRWGNLNLQLPWLCFLPAVMVRSVLRFTAVPLTVSRQPLFLMLPQIWYVCVRRSTSV